MKLPRMLAFVVLAAGCGGSQKPATPKGPTCADAAANVHALMMAQGATTEVDMTALAELSRAVVAERCPADGWSAEAITCLAKATVENIESCKPTLTDEQNRKLDAAAKARMDAMPQKKDESDDAESMPEDRPVGSPAPGAAPPPPPPSRSRPPSDPCGGDE